MDDRLQELEHHVAEMLDRVAELEHRVFELEEEPVPIVPDDCPRDLKGAEVPLVHPEGRDTKIVVPNMYS